MRSARAAHAQLTPVANADTKTVGLAAPNVLSPELVELIVAQGSVPLENATAQFPYHGYDGNGPHLPPLGSNVEATKTEPDKNTYLVFEEGLSGPDPSYDYGTHFVYQGHENGVPVVLPGAPAGTTINGSYITRINLDADGAHKVTLLADHTDTGVPLQKIDGSSWDPFARKLLFTTESGFANVPSGQPAQPGPSIYQATPDFPSSVQDLSTSSAALASKPCRTTIGATSISSRTLAGPPVQAGTPGRGSRTASSSASSRPTPPTCRPAGRSRRFR